MESKNQSSTVKEYRKIKLSNTINKNLILRKMVNSLFYLYNAGLTWTGTFFNNLLVIQKRAVLGPILIDLDSIKPLKLNQMFKEYYN